MTETYLPYNGTSGWSGSDTSESRALEADTSGKTKKRQQQAINALRESGYVGLTWIELQQVMPLHHGTLSGVLSVLHKEGVICRLSEKRGKCKVYVLPEFVGARLTENQGRSKNCPHCGGAL
jgi:hypothetical protein